MFDLLVRISPFARASSAQQHETEEVKRDWREHPNQELVKAWQDHFQGDTPPEDGPIPAPYELVWEHFGNIFTDAEKERIIRSIDVDTAETLEVRFRLLTLPVNSILCANCYYVIAVSPVGRVGLLCGADRHRSYQVAAVDLPHLSGRSSG